MSMNTQIARIKSNQSSIKQSSERLAKIQNFQRGNNSVPPKQRYFSEQTLDTEMSESLTHNSNNLNGYLVAANKNNNNNNNNSFIIKKNNFLYTTTNKNNNNMQNSDNSVRDSVETCEETPTDLNKRFDGLISKQSDDNIMEESMQLQQHSYNLIKLQSAFQREIIKPIPAFDENNRSRKNVSFKNNNNSNNVNFNIGNNNLKQIIKNQQQQQNQNQNLINKINQQQQQPDKNNNNILNESVALLNQLKQSNKKYRSFLQKINGNNNNNNSNKSIRPNSLQNNNYNNQSSYVNNNRSIRLNKDISRDITPPRGDSTSAKQCLNLSSQLQNKFSQVQSQNNNNINMPNLMQNKYISGRNSLERKQQIQQQQQINQYSGERKKKKDIMFRQSQIYQSTSYFNDIDKFSMKNISLNKINNHNNNNVKSLNNI